MKHAPHAITRRDVPVSMRLREDDLALIDRGAASSGLSRTEFLRRAAIDEAQRVILDETLLRLSPDAFAQFVSVVEALVSPIPDKLKERMARTAPWTPGR
jgi:uncharacterized protein (DUF1778 family)